MSVTNTLSSDQSAGNPQLRTLSTMPSWRQNSIVRTLTSSILAGLSLFSRSSTNSVATPRRPRSAASASPIGPPPAISTGVSRSVSAINAKPCDHRPRSRRFGLPQPGRPIFPRAADRARLQVERTRLLDFDRRQVADAAERLRLALHLRIAAREHGTKHHLFHRNTRHGRAVPPHQHNPVRAERAGKRLPLFRLGNDQVGVAEFVTLVPEWNDGTHRRTQMIDRLQRHP